VLYDPIIWTLRGDRDTVGRETTLMESRRAMIRKYRYSHRSSSTISAGDVTTYLRTNPDFLVRHPDVIEHLTPPRLQRGDNVLDLQHHMVGRLQARIGQMRGQQQALVAAVKASLDGQNRVHVAALMVLDAQSFGRLIEIITVDLATLLDLDAVLLVVESGQGDLPACDGAGVRVVAAGSVDGWLGQRDVVITRNICGSPSVFKGSARLVRSEMLVRLRVNGETPPGMLALGSRQPDLSHQGLGTEPMCFLARTIERCIRSWLDLPT